jgi:hypothetical protein
MTEAEKRIREALKHWPTLIESDDIAALLAEIDRLRQWEVTGREWIDKTDWMQSGPTPVRWLGKHRADALRDEITLLRAAIDRQPAPPSAESIEWAGKAFLADSLKENDALRAEVEALRAALEPFAGAEPEYSAGGLYTILVNGRDLTAARAALAQARETK